MTKTVFNRNKVDFTKQYMFFGEDQNTQRYDVFRYPESDKLNQTMLGYFWRPEEVSLQKDRGDYAEFTFTGNGISILGTKMENRGHADIFLDGEKIYTLDGYADRLKEPNISTSAHSTQYLSEYLNYVIPEKQELYSVAGLSNGPHTIKVLVTGTKQDGASDYGIAIDAFEISSCMNEK